MPEQSTNWHHEIKDDQASHYSTSVLCFSGCVWWCPPLFAIPGAFLSSIRGRDGAACPVHTWELLRGKPRGITCVFSDIAGWDCQLVRWALRVLFSTVQFLYVVYKPLFENVYFWIFICMCASHDVTSPGKKASLHSPGETLSYCNYTWFRLQEKVSLFIGNR